MASKVRLLGATALVATAVAAVASASATELPQARSAATRAVTLKDIAFKPAKLTVSRGTKVRFTWKDGTSRHDVKSVGRPRFKAASARQEGGATHRVTFAKKGTYRYECTLHPGMTGRISVR